MNLVEFPEQTIVIAKDQKQYNPMPAFVDCRPEKNGRIICCWRLSWRERFRLLFTGLLWHEIMSFCTPIQPVRLSVDKPPMEADESRRLVKVVERERGLDGFERS